MQIGIFGSIGYDDIGDDALLISNIIELNKSGNKLIIFTKNISKTYDLLKVHHLVPSHGLSKNILVVESLDVYLSRETNVFKYFDFIVDTISDKLFKSRLGVFNLSNVKYIKHKLQKCCKKNGVGNPKLNEFTKNIEKCSIILFMGGGYFNKHWGGKINQFLLTMDVAHYLKKPIFASGLTFGPLNIIQQILFKKRIHYFQHIAVRDVDRSAKNLARLKFCPLKVSEGPDDAIFLEKKKPLNFKIPISDFNVIINFGGFLKYSKKPINIIYQAIASLLDYLIKVKKAKIICVSMDRYSSDYLKGIKIQQYMENPEHLSFVPINTESSVIKNIINQSSLVIASRLHPIVFAIAEKTPFIGVSAGGEYYDTKLKGITECYGYVANKHIIDVNEISLKNLKKILNSALIDKPDNDIYIKNQAKRSEFLNILENFTK